MSITELSEKIRRAYLVSGNVIEKDGKYLLVQEKKESVKGKWNLPAGKAEEGLTLEENAAKEAKEETGYDVEVIYRVGVYFQEGDKSVKFAFKSNIVGGELKIPEDELLDVKWFAIEELVRMEKDSLLRDPWVLQAIKDSRGSVNNAQKNPKE